MIIHILDMQMELETEKESVEKIFDMIKSTIDKGDHNFSYMVVDGEEIYDEFEDYIEENIKSIEEIKVVMLTTKELILDNMITTTDYISSAVPAINKLSDGFYKEPNTQEWDDLGELFGGIGWIIESFQSIDSVENLNDLVSSYETWNEYAKEVHSLNEYILELEGAMENSDIILIGDLLSYEIVPIFENMKQKLDLLISN